MTLARQLERDLAALGNPTRAVNEKAYLKSELVHFGVPMPVIRKTVVAAVSRDLDHDALVATVETLWSRGIHELRVAAIEALLRCKQRLTTADLPLLERLVRESKTWAYVDVLATHLIGHLVETDPGLVKTLDRFARDDDFWIRRTAMLALLGPLRRGSGDFARFGRYADAMLDEREFFIRKAIGWILRETSRKQPGLVYDWLLPRAARASGVTMREALKYLSPAQRSKLTAARAR